MWRMIRPMLPMVVILAIPIVPFLVLGESMEAQAVAWRENPPSPVAVAALVLALLASDIFLPVPSSVVGTLAGFELGTLLGTVVAWAGMNAGAIIGFALAKKWGPSFARWLASEAELERAAAMSQRFGPTLLALVRGVPVLAEASVLWMGMHGLRWRAFLPPVVLSNLVLAAVYAALGHYAERHDWLAMALAAAVAIPVALAAAARRWLPQEE